MKKALLTPCSKSIISALLSCFMLLFPGIGTSAPVKAQKTSSSSTVFSYGKFKVGSTVYVFTDKVNLRESPSVSSKLVNQLKLGQTLLIKARSEETHEVNGYKDYWYEVAGKGGEQAFSGYLWGGLIAKVALKANLDGDPQNELILLGLSGKGAENHLKLAEARVIDDGTLISKTSFSPIETAKDNFFTYTVKAALLKDKGFVPFIQLIKIRFEYDSANFENGEVLLALKGKQISQVSSNKFDNKNDLKYVFPSDPSGKENQLKVLLLNDGSEILKATYQWNGKSFKKLQSASSKETSAKSE